MEGKKIGAVNQAIREVVPDIKDLNDNADALIKIAALQFSSGAAWITANGPVEAGQFNWTDIDVGGTTDFGAMCRALNDKLSPKAFLNEATGSYKPVLFLLSDGDPTDDWEKGLELLKKNNWYNVAIKVAIAIGDDVNKDVLTKFAGNKEMVLEVYNSAVLMRMIKAVSVRASQVASKNYNVDSSGDEAVETIREIKEEIAEEAADYPKEL
jgi:uncharacterized protein YegL